MLWDMTPKHSGLNTLLEVQSLTPWWPWTCGFPKAMQLFSGRGTAVPTLLGADSSQWHLDIHPCWFCWRQVRSWHHSRHIPALSPSPSSITCSLWTPLTFCYAFLGLSWHPQQEAEGDVSCCWERRWIRQPRNKDHFTSQLLTECLCLRGTDGTIRDGAGRVLNLIPADKWKPGASLWFYRVVLAFGQN